LGQAPKATLEPDSKTFKCLWLEPEPKSDPQLEIFLKHCSVSLIGIESK